MDFAQFIIDLLLFFVYSLLLLLIIAWWLRFWKMYVNQKYLNGLKWLLLEIKLPREIDKSPIAMEIALNSLIQGGGVSNWFAREYQGKLPAWFSLEIASLEGIVHFYIRTEKKYKELIESNLYSQYPGIEITEASDYTKLIRYEHNKEDQTKFWGIRHKTGATWKPYPDEKDGKGEDYKMPADFKPLKTYVDYELDKDPKEEYKNDPLTPLIEFLGSVSKGEYAWYQVLVQDSEGVFNGKKFPKTYIDPKTKEHMSLGEMASKYKDLVRSKLKNKKGEVAVNKYGYAEQEVIQREVKDKEGNVIQKEVKGDIKYKEDVYETRKEMDLTPEEKDELEAINRKLSKPLVRAIVRIGYITKPKSFNSAHIQNTLSMFKSFTSQYNSFIPSKNASPYDFPWENTMKRRDPWRGEEIFKAMVEREGFMPHVDERKSLDKSEDIFFFPYKTYVRSTWRSFYEAFFHPFHHPKNDDVITLNLEELVTLWHFPGAVAQTPTLPRIDSTKGVAPTNLPM